jgi:NAD-dependent DNA ligase
MIEQLKEQIIKANVAYRVGKPIMSDAKYDQLIEELQLLSPDDELLSKIGHDFADESRKERLPIPMFSMNKIKSMDDINDWCRLKSIPKSSFVIITPKYDGLSLCVNEVDNSAWTRGNGTFGQKSDSHYNLINNKLELDNNSFSYTYGEVMMSKKKFMDKYANDFANPRNLVAGLINSKEATESLKDCDYIKYGAIQSRNTFQTKKQIIDELNSGQVVKVPYHICRISELSEELLINLFHEYSQDYEIDGLIIEINDLNQQTVLGRETSSNNPVSARAFKHESFEQKVETEVIDIEWNISKNSLLKPVAIVRPVNIDGVVVSRCTLNNTRFIKDMGIGVGSIVVIKRSGLVIPKIVEVIKKVEFNEPVIEGLDIGWNDAGIELIVLNETPEQFIKRNISFFEILEADNIGEGVIKNLYNFGFKTIADILNLTKEDLEKLDGFGKRKAQIVWNSIKKATSNVSLSKLQHATGIFKNMGSKKLALLEHFDTKPTIEEVLKIDGIGEVLAKEYVNNYDKFFDFISDLPVSIQEKIELEPVGSDLEGMVVVYTGIRDKISEELIVSKGGKIGSSVSKNTTHLVCKDPYSGSSKLEKAKSLGVKILSLEDLNVLLKNSF